MNVMVAGCGGRYAPEFAVGVAWPGMPITCRSERQVRMMAREGLRVDSQTLWDQLQAMARHLEPTYAALGHRALEASVISVDETRWAIMGAAKPAAGTVWGVHAPAVTFYRILSGKSTEEGRQVLGGYRGIVVADGFMVLFFRLLSLQNLHPRFKSWRCLQFSLANLQGPGRRRARWRVDSLLADKAPAFLALLWLTPLAAQL